MTDGNRPSENKQDGSGSGSGSGSGAGRNVRLRGEAEEISQAPPTHSTTASQNVVEAEKHNEIPPGRKEQGQSIQIDPAVASKIAANVDDFMTLVHEADAANERERDMKLSTAFKIYPKAIGWSAVLSSCLVMEGYDTSIVGSLINKMTWCMLLTLHNSWEDFAYPVFKNKFGEPAPNGDMVISAAWQNGIQGATNVGEIIGLQLGGIPNNDHGLRGRSMPGPVETLSHCLRESLLDNGRLHIVRYKIPFALQWIWPIPIAIGCYLAPESPWWCVRRGHKDRAERSLKRLARREGFSQRDADAAMALMIYTDEMEKQVATGTTYWDCFRGLDLRRTEIVCMTWMAQTMAGGAISGLSAFFFQQAGISAADSFKLGWGQNALGAVGTMASWLILNKVGRKTLMFWGMVVMFVLLLITGFMGIHTPPSTAEAWTAGTMVVLLTAVSNFSVGPVVYTIVSEIPSTRLRAKSIILARNAYNAINIAFVNVLSYRQVTPAEWNWGPKAAFFWAGMNAIFTAYIFFRLPETQGRTYAELDILFENKIPARKFASTKIDTLARGTEGAQKEQADRLAAPATSTQEYT
ncbi:MFS transporter- SP family- general alpha glucoside:H+ symporter [Apiospora rasikravindrae]|uniref:MFS transporter- SP family- general alpha glucoside:H+ symporter n=1 Tax=Apiospora rasikravindrae TaxID=990691 RepID=A0ABR1SYG9_9PEZI